MKKLMIAACAVAFATAAQAASVSWRSGSFPGLSDCGGVSAAGGDPTATGFGPTFDTPCIKAFIFESTTALDYADSAAVWAAYKDQLDSATVSAEFNLGASNIQKDGLGTYEEGELVYAAIIYTHSDTQDFENPDFYIANLASAEASPDGTIVQELATKWGGTGESITWAAATTAAPEPTSGLLLLLGVAGLALRRRRA